MKHEARVLTRRFGAVVVMLLALGLAVVGTTPPAQAATAPSPAATTLFEHRVVNAINAQRASYHRGRLSLSTCPQRYADRWAPSIVSQLRHQSMLTILKGCGATVAAENLAAGNLSPTGIVAAWMKSPGHRANILDSRLNRIGVGAVYARGRWNVVADFTRS